MLRRLKLVRRVSALICLALLTWIFLDPWETLGNRFIESFLSLQIITAITAMAGGSIIAVAGILSVIALTFLGGRIYCSALCPLGIFQDGILAIARLFRKKRKRFAHVTHPLALQYTLAGAMLIAALAGNMVLAGLLDPYSLYGRVASSLLQPIFVEFVNTGAGLLSWLGMPLFNVVQRHPLSFGMIGFSIAFTGLIGWVTVKRGRWFCTTICPVGGVLGLISKRSVFAIQFDDVDCKGCSLCEKVCKAECINFAERTIDIESCVVCFNCIDVCPKDGLLYRRNKKRTVLDVQTAATVMGSRRQALVQIGILAAATARAEETPADTLERQSKFDTRSPVVPPGGLSKTRYLDRCIGCQLCVSVCPTRVLQPAIAEFGWEGLFQPRMDYEKSFCNFECILCTTVCPTNALVPLKQVEKKRTQIGKTIFVKEDCVVVTKKKDCGACAEHCPTKAVMMVKSEGLFLPEVRNQYCIGCGACEFACPTEPRKAIYVQANAIHAIADEPPKKSAVPLEKTLEEFPF